MVRCVRPAVCIFKRLFKISHPVAARSLFAHCKGKLRGAGTFQRPRHKGRHIKILRNRPALGWGTEHRRASQEMHLSPLQTSRNGRKEQGTRVT